MQVILILNLMLININDFFKYKYMVVPLVHSRLSIFKYFDKCIV